MLSWRILSSVIGIPLILGIFYLGNWSVTTLMLVISLVGVYEFHQLMERLDYSLNLLLSMSVITFIMLAAHFNLPAGLVLTVSCLAILSFQVFFSVNSSLREGSAHLMAVFYVGWLFSYAIYLARWNYQLVFWVFIINWSCDIMAYVVGMLIGKHPLAPAISPKKTIEGAFGGLLGAILGGLLGWRLFFTGHPLFLALALGLALGIGGQIGDLVESRFKREAKVKDSGRLIPGHGGILDRFDSLLFNLPLMYYLLQLYNNFSLGKPLL